MSLKLGHQLMIYIGFILPVKGFEFTYETIQQLLKDNDKKHYHLSTLRKEYSNLKREGLIENKTRYRKPVPVLTQKGKLAIKTRLPFKSYGTWDGKWRMIIFDIPETERQYRWALRDKLTQLGFGQIQKSAYLSPYPLLGPLNRFSSELGIRQYLRFIEISKIDDEKKLIEKTWNLEKINNEYQNFIHRSKNAKTDIYWPLLAKKLEQEFVIIYEMDPRLPEKFLPKNWAGTPAYKIFKEISNSY